jgi:hypothetical protein
VSPLEPQHLPRPEDGLATTSIGQEGLDFHCWCKTLALAGATPHASPWVDLAGLAESTLADASGLKPWWILPGAKTENVLFTVPTSEQEARFKWLQEQVLLYRLTLGHPNQEDLLELLQRDGDVSREQVRKSSLELSAYFGSSNADPATA